MSSMSQYDKVSFSPTAKLPWVDKLVYSAASGISTNISWVAFGYYLMFFYTDILGISATVAGSIMLFARVFDAFTDVVMGWAVDRFNFKWGKYRSWIIISLAPITLLFIGTFTAIPGLSDTAKIVWATITHGCFGAIGGQVMGILLDGSGYVANQTQTPETLSNLLFIAFMVPAILTMVQFGTQCFYGLTDKQCAKCVEEVQKRAHAAAGS